MRSPVNSSPLCIAFLVQQGTKMTPTWTTAHLAQAALRAGHRVWFLSPGDIEIGRRGRVLARVHQPDARQCSRARLVARLVAGTLPRRHVELRRCDILLLRLNPLTDSALAMALLAREIGVHVVNDPAGVALTRSKAWLATLPDIPRPRTLVTRSLSGVQMFAADLGGPVVVKPAIGSGGKAVSLVPPGRSSELVAAFRQASTTGDGMVVAQEYLPAAADGEKRLVWMDGEILGGYLRRRGAGDFRHNLRQGGQPVETGIDDDDHRIARLLRPHLERNGIRIAGLDVIGGAVVEVNTLNPGGVHHASRLRGPSRTDGDDIIADRVVRKLAEIPEGTHGPTNLR
ncbi:MAG: hypothetical protein D6798_08765 [Deltaproteobacteria bacterium]|nr:MAG: hypothetical protein D6798_08765 [Deltaproteobacteria bacterium]